jgi:hypothetical protein
MIKCMLSATMALSILTGGALAQTSTSSTTSTQTTTAIPMPAQTTAVNSMSEHTVGADGVVTDKTKTTANGTVVSPAGDTIVTRKSTETQTVR